VYITEIIKAIVFGIVEGITEWLPISSTGHMILLNELVHLNMSDAFQEMFLVVIQLGAILAVIITFFKKLNPFSSNRNGNHKKETFQLWLKIILACIPAGLIGFLFEDQIDELFFNFKTVAATLIIYGILFILIERRNKTRYSSINELSQLNYAAAVMIGIFQMLSLIPGTSRSGATILGAILIGTSRSVAAEFSFFLSIPIMLGASGLKLLKFGFSFSNIEIAVLFAGMITAFLVSAAAIKFLMGYIKKHDFTLFGYYRIFLGILVLLFFSLLR
jgi:undecaprenyl-diphosphatase